jgi:hypothetical protein
MLAEQIESNSKYFGTGADGKPKIQSVMNSQDLISQPSMVSPDNEVFKKQVESLFRDTVVAQMKIEAETPYGALALEPSLVEQQVHDAWVIGAKLPDVNAEAPVLSIGDTLVRRQVQETNVRHVWSTSRSEQSASERHSHFSSDLNTIGSAEFASQMQEIQRSRQDAGCRCALVVYFMFGNTGGNCETDPVSGKSLNHANIESTRSFLAAAQSQGWLDDVNVRFVVVSSFHCSPAYTGYNDRLPVRPSVDAYGSEDSASYKQALMSAQASAGLLEYTSSKFASIALFAAALTKDVALQHKLHSYVAWVHNLHCKIEKAPTRAYAPFNEWVLDTVSDDINQLGTYVDGFYEDTAGSSAHVCHPDLMSRLQVVKIPFSLTTMIARRAPRVSLTTGVKSLHDSWIRTKGRLGWAITPSTAAAWLEAAAARMDLLQDANICEEVCLQTEVDVAEGGCNEENWHSTVKSQSPTSAKSLSGVLGRLQTELHCLEKSYTGFEAVAKDAKHANCIAQ